MSNSLPLFLREAPVSHQTVERTGDPLPVDAVLSMNNDGYAGTGVRETIGQQRARVTDFFRAFDDCGNTFDSTPGFMGAL